MENIIQQIEILQEKMKNKIIRYNLLDQLNTNISEKYSTQMSTKNTLNVLFEFKVEPWIYYSN